MTNDPPPLALSDIMHPFTPSPSQEEDGEDPPRPQSATPETLDQTQIEAIKSRLSDLGFSDSSAPNITSREQELIDMVDRLSNSIRPDLSQLLAQAQTIYQLRQQREISAREFEEERARWDAERLGWPRMGEALISRRRESSGSFQHEEMDRHIASLQADNKSLRQRLSDTQSRLTMLESELMHLRPLLMLQPIAVPSLSNVPGVQRSAQITEMKHPSSRTHRKKDHFSKDNGNGDVSVLEEEVDELADDEDPTETPRQKPRTTRGARASKGKARSHNDKATSVMSDARAEHMLLAARRLGRQRVAYLSGLVAQQMDEKVLDGKDVPSTSTPRTPKRGGAQVHANSQFHTHPHAYVYLNSPAGPSPGVPVLVPVSSDNWPMHTPMSPTKYANRTSGTASNVHATPLDSLVSAAKSILDDDQSPTKLPTKRERARRVSEEIDSPVPKRKKVSAMGQDSSRRNNSSNLGRVRSALDVLADQAAVFSSQEKGVDDSVGPPVDEQSLITSRGRSDITSTGRRRSTRTRRSIVDQQEVARNQLSPLAQYSHSGNSVPPPSRSTTTTPKPPSDAGRAFLASAVNIDSAPHPRPVHGDDSTFTSPRSPLTTKYRPVSSSATFTVRGHPPPGNDQMNPDKYSAEVETIGVTFSPGYSPDHGLAINTDYSSQRGGARITMDPSNSGMIPVKKKRADDKRAKTPYKKWSKEEDEVLAQAVAKYGPKWDQVQKALPERGYHQVRQRWLRRLRSVDHTKVTDSVNSVGAQMALNAYSGADGAGRSVAPNPKLGLAPLSSEIAVAASKSYPPNPPIETPERPPPPPVSDKS